MRVGTTAVPYTTKCRVCGETLQGLFVTREMMFGLRDAFTYGECGGCGSVQLCDPPANMSRYYPENYYAFQPRQRSGLKHRVRCVCHRCFLGRRGPFAKAFARLKPHPATPWLERTGARRASRILDVGCGHGDLLRDLHEAGFRRLRGVDAFIPETVAPAPGLRIIKGTLADLREPFDIIMFHHSLEHMEDQRGTLAAAAALLDAGGWCLIRVPIVSSFAWRHYRENWIQLDPPRHFVLHSTESLRRVAGEAGLVLRRMDFDSNSLQFVGSEAYLRDVPLVQSSGLFSEAEEAAFTRRAMQLNEEGQGDQAAFYFQKAGTGPAAGSRGDARPH